MSKPEERRTPRMVGGSTKAFFSRSAAMGVSPAVTPLAHPWLHAPLESALFATVPRREIVHITSEPYRM